eukprot:365952-Chlamydomonas_euryale.AAC.4
MPNPHTSQDLRVRGVPCGTTALPHSPARATRTAVHLSLYGPMYARALTRGSQRLNVSSDVHLSSAQVPPLKCWEHAACCPKTRIVEHRYRSPPARLESACCSVKRAILAFGRRWPGCECVVPTSTCGESSESLRCNCDLRVARRQRSEPAPQRDPLTCAARDRQHAPSGSLFGEPRDARDDRSGCVPPLGAIFLTEAGCAIGNQPIPTLRRAGLLCYDCY